MKLKKPCLLFFSIALSVIPLIPAFVVETGVSAETMQPRSDHFDGVRYFNPGISHALSTPPGQSSKRSGTWWIWKMDAEK